MPNKRLVQTALTVVQSPQRAHPVTKSRQALAEEGYGRVVGREYRVTLDDIERLKVWLGREGVDWQLPADQYGVGHREEAAAQGRNEKHARLTTGDKRLLIQPMSAGVLANGRELPVLPEPGMCLSVDGSSITSLCAGALVVIENSRAFQRIRDQLLTVVPHRWLAVYRGDTEYASGQVWARDQARQHRIRLFAYPDFDPAGLMIAISMGAEHVLVPDLDALENVPGKPDDFDRQQDQWSQLQRAVPPGSILSNWVDFLRQRKAGFTQEHLLSYRIPLELVPVERVQ